ncbi:MAG: hypothetical protein ABSF14_24090, partial [Terriglobia bacterium]
MTRKAESKTEERNNIVDNIADNIADNIVDMKGFLEIENNSRRFIEIKEITLDDNTDISTMYLLKVAQIDIRLYIDLDEAKKDGRFMQHVVKQ